MIIRIRNKWLLKKAGWKTFPKDGVSASLGLWYQWFKERK